MKNQQNKVAEQELSTIERAASDDLLTVEVPSEIRAGVAHKSPGSKTSCKNKLA